VCGDAVDLAASITGTYIVHRVVIPPPINGLQK
jgi:hypothetical protein